MTQKAYDICVVSGVYFDNNGQKKNRYRNIGSVIVKDDGGKFLLLDPMVNLAAVQREEGRDMVIASLFPPKTAEQHPQAAQAQQYQQPQGMPDDDIPF